MTKITLTPEQIKKLLILEFKKQSYSIKTYTRLKSTIRNNKDGKYKNKFLISPIETMFVDLFMVDYKTDGDFLNACQKMKKHFEDVKLKVINDNK